VVEGHLTPILGYGWVGLISAFFTVVSVILAGRLRPCEEGLAAVDVPADAAAPESAALVA
jgi:hypothetical protein